ncbi:MAG: ATP-dependent serine peptidase containing a PDZ domain protein [Microbacterium sp.]|nr:ATP-dependent serine peptidase containing a PDZ domain protein [Microbacterium sp.]MBA4344914.1 ATP-dependent serine peptidase containing a PDZ domain protein [Microbacterium sp.]
MDDARVRARRVGWLLLSLTLFGVFGLAVLPSPYVIERPGPVFDTLGTVTVDGEEVPLIEIPTEPTFETEGSLSLLTVNIFGNRDQPPTWFEVIGAWLAPSQSVVPIDAVFPEGVSTEDRREQSRIDMENSQQEAVAAALRAIGEPYESQLRVVEAVADGPSDGTLRSNDIILAVNDEPVRDVTALRAAIAANGTAEPVLIDIERAGTDRTVLVTPELSDGEERVPVIGVLIAGEYVFPFEVNIELQNVGGPSAGMMFALGIIDKLTPDSLAGGEDVAGTGTIAADGSVGPIGGIVQKMFGAVDSGAEWFLAPVDNCDEVAGNVPGGLEVFAVATLDEAIEVLQTIADEGDLSELARCER